MRAYKGLLKEKEALEASLSALAKTSSSKPKLSSDGSSEATEGQQSPDGEGQAAASADAESEVKTHFIHLRYILRANNENSILRNVTFKNKNVFSKRSIAMSVTV